MTTPEDVRGMQPHVGAWLHEQGSLREMTDRLRALAVGWSHQGKPKNAQRCQEAAQALEEGCFSVRVGATTYSVVGEPQSTISDVS